MRFLSSGLIVAIAAGAFLASPFPARRAAAQADLKADCARLARQGNFRICQRAVAAVPNDPRVRRHYGLSLSAAGDYTGAIEQFRKIAELTPNDPVAHFEHAWMLAFVRRYPEAIAPIERALALKPDYRRALIVAAIIYATERRQTDRLRVVLAAARLGERIAMFDAYDLHLNGIGTARDDRAAFQWLHRAAVAGHVGAMDRLVQIYLNGGLGQPQDLKAAARWATRARVERLGGMNPPR